MPTSWMFYFRIVFYIRFFCDWSKLVSMHFKCLRAYQMTSDNRLSALLYNIIIIFLVFGALCHGILNDLRPNKIGHMFENMNMVDNIEHVFYKCRNNNKLSIILMFSIPRIFFFFLKRREDRKNRSCCCSYCYC